MSRSVFNAFLLIISWLAYLPAAPEVNIYDSGGMLMPQQAAYDVIFYDLNLNVSPADSSIKGSVRIDARIVHPLHEFVFDLDTLLKISSIEETGTNVSPSVRDYNLHGGKVYVRLNGTRQPGEKLSILVHYGGKPLVAEHPPWKGGFSWDTTANGSPWIATSCEGEGGDIWWPTKDHISDKPDSMALHIRVPDPLICASNGRLRSVEKHSDQTSTYHWFVSTPITGYNVALNIAPYQVIERDFQSVAGDIFPVKFWVLPEDYEKGKIFMEEIIAHLRFYEENLGPYPFRADKYGVVQTPHLGMEHQTIIAYGARFNNSAMTGKDWGFDGLHHHELAHEWWGNLVTCEDWSDIWIHEGFGTYMQALYIEQNLGRGSYHEFIDRWRTFKNDIPVAPRRTLTANEAFSAPVYSKGAWVIHSLRYLVGDKAFRTILRRMAYPDPLMEKITDGRQVRYASTDDLIRIIKEETGQDMNWFADVYLRQAELPRLVYEIFENKMNIHWKVPGGLPFFMPVDIKLGNRILRVELGLKPVQLTIPTGTDPVIDPENWVLRALD